MSIEHRQEQQPEQQRSFWNQIFNLSFYFRSRSQAVVTAQEPALPNRAKIHALLPLNTTAEQLLSTSQAEALREAVDFERIFALLQSGQNPVTLSFSIGKLEFTVHATQPSRNHEVVDCTIKQKEDTDFIIDMRFIPEDHELIIHNADTGSLKGKKFYSIILRALLRKCNRVENSVTNDETTHLPGYSRRTDADDAPDCLLKTNSPLVGARGKDFISTLEQGSSRLVSFRVPEYLSDLLELAKEWYDDPENYDIGQIVEFYTDYKQTEEYKNLSTEVTDLFDRQLEYLERQRR